MGLEEMTCSRAWLAGKTFSRRVVPSPPSPDAAVNVTRSPSYSLPPFLKEKKKKRREILPIEHLTTAIHHLAMARSKLVSNSPTHPLVAN